MVQIPDEIKVIVSQASIDKTIREKTIPPAFNLSELTIPIDLSLSVKIASLDTIVSGLKKEIIKDKELKNARNIEGIYLHSGSIDRFDADEKILYYKARASLVILTEEKNAASLKLSREKDYELILCKYNDIKRIHSVINPNQDYCESNPSLMPLIKDFILLKYGTREIGVVDSKALENILEKQLPEGIKIAVALLDELLRDKVTSVNNAKNLAYKLKGTVICTTPFAASIKNDQSLIDGSNMYLDYNSLGDLIKDSNADSRPVDIEKPIIKYRSKYIQSILAAAAGITALSLYFSIKGIYENTRKYKTYSDADAGYKSADAKTTGISTGIKPESSKIMPVKKTNRNSPKLKKHRKTIKPGFDVKF